MTTTAAVFEPTQWGEQKISPAFFAALAKALGATDLDAEGHGHARMTVGDVALSFRQGYGAKARRMDGHAFSADRDAHQRVHRYGRPVSFPEASFDPSRDLDALAKDIRKRLIEKSAPALASIAARAAQQRANEDAINTAADKMRRAFPQLRVEVKDTSASLWAPGMTARLDRDEAVTFDRLSLSADKARRVLAIILEA